jgi:hypothetical protein
MGYGQFRGVEKPCPLQTLSASPLTTFRFSVVDMIRRVSPSLWVAAETFSVEVNRQMIVVLLLRSSSPSLWAILAQLLTHFSSYFYFSSGFPFVSRSFLSLCQRSFLYLVHHLSFPFLFVLVVVVCVTLMLVLLFVAFSLSFLLFPVILLIPSNFCSAGVRCATRRGSSFHCSCPQGD